MMPGSPATPSHPLARRIAYFLIGALLALTSGFSNALLVANLPQIQGALGLTSVEGAWLTAAYSMSNICMSLLLIKLRQQFGAGWFIRLFLPAFVGVALLQFFVHSYSLELVARALSGVTASALSSVALFYVMQAMPASARLAGMVIGTGLSQVALPLARVISPTLLEGDEVQLLFLLELGLSLLCMAAAALLRLPPSETVDAFEPLDFVTFLLMVPGMALLCGVLSVGRIVWWHTPWVGWSLAASIVLVAAALLIEHHRANPLLNTRWLGSSQILQFGLMAAVMRVLLSEQGFGSLGLLTAVGMGQEQLVTLYVVVTLATLAGLVASVRAMNPNDLLRPILVSTVLIAIGAWMDSDASNLTRPAQFYISQALISFAAILFLGPLMMVGIVRALAQGPSHIVSFSAIFGIAQTLGGLGGSALLGSFQIIRERWHSEVLTQNLLAGDPLVSGRIDALSASYGRVLVDAAQRRLQGNTLFGQQLTREANILAYNDVFLLIAVLAALASLIVGARWLWLRSRGINPLAAELAAMAAMRARQAEGK